MNQITYQIGEALYLNITNRCTNQCQFCIRHKTKLLNGEYPLWLDREPATEEIIKAIGDPSQCKEIVFCGYGEPLLRLDTVKAVVGQLKSEIRNPKSETIPKFKIRINTNGHANLFWGRNILPELKGLIDSISISLDAENAKIYEQICQPSFGQRAYPAVLEFIKEAKKYLPEVEATVVDLPMINKKACQKIADKLGVRFRVRAYYEEKYVR